MSFDPNQSTPMGSVPPKKSGGALKWILGGLGCFGLIIALCVGGFGYFAYVAYQNTMNNNAYLEGRANLENSEALGEVLGNPVTVSETPTGFNQSQQGERIEIKYGVGISGPKASGTATITVQGHPMSIDGWELDSVTAEVDGNDIPLDGNALDIVIEDEE